MQAHLLVKSLWGITSGDKTQPSDADSSAAITWREKSGQAAGSIYLMLEPDIQVMVAQHLMDAAVMWKKLKEMYEQVNPAVESNNPKGLSESSSEHNCCLFIDIKTYLSPAVSTTVKGVHTAGLLHLYTDYI